MLIRRGATLPQRCLAGFISGLLLMAFDAAAQTPPPVAVVPAPAIASTHRIPVTQLRMGRLKVRLEQTTLDEVRQALASGAIAHQGDAGASTYWLCYTSARARQPVRIWIVSDGEMGGNRHAVTGVSAAIVADAQPTMDCPALPPQFAALSLDNHQWLGSTASDARSSLGRAAPRPGGWQSYAYLGKLPGKCEGGAFDLTSQLTLHYRKGRVDALQAGHITSC